jgi:predicted dehydrogenase
MSADSVKVGIVGLGRWAKVLTRAAGKSEKLQIIAGYSRSEEKRHAFEQELGVRVVPDLNTLLSDPGIAGVILTVPNEQHLPVAAQVAKARKHVYTEKPIASTLEDGLQIAALEQKHGITVTVGHSARLMAGIRQIRAAIDSGELGRVAFIEANFSNERALELTPKTWRWYKDKAPGGPLSQLAIHQFDVLHYLGGEIVEASSMASKLSPVGAEVDDQSMTLLKFADGKVGYVGSCWTSPGVFAVRVFGSKGLMHYEIDFHSLHPARQERLRESRRAESRRKRHVPHRARIVCRELPDRQVQRTQCPQRQHRRRHRECRVALHRKRRTGCARGGSPGTRPHAGRGEQPPCCLAATSST